MTTAENKPVIGLSWEPKVPDFSSGRKSSSKSENMGESSVLWKPNTELVDGLFVPSNDPKKVNKLLRMQRKDTLGKDWFDMPAPTMTPELKNDLKLLKLRNVMDPKRHYKRSDSKSKELPKYFQVGKVVESPLDFFSGRLAKKERKLTFADELLSDLKLKTYRKRKVREIEEKDRGNGNKKWKTKDKYSRKRAKGEKY